MAHYCRYKFLVLVLTFCYFCILGPHHPHKASNHHKINTSFLFTVSLSHKLSDMWDVECLLSFMGSWALASLTAVKFAWKTSLLALVPANIVLIWLCYILIISNFFSNLMLLFLFWHLVVRWNDWVIYKLKFALNSIWMLIFALSFTWRLNYTVLSLLGRSRIDLRCALCFWGNNRQHMPVCAKTISSWVTKIWGVAKAHMSPGSLHDTVVSAAYAVGVSLMSILQPGDWVRVSIPARHYFSSYISIRDWYQDSIQWGVLGLSEESPFW